MRAALVIVLVLAEVLVLAGRAAAGERPAPVRFDHLFTLGSRYGIHPTRALNGKAATLVFGGPERPYALANPEGVTVDAGRRIWIADRGTRSVHVFDLRHGGYQEIRSAGGYAFECPAGVASDAAGAVYITDADTGRVYVFSGNGEFERM